MRLRRRPLLSAVTVCMMMLALASCSDRDPRTLLGPDEFAAAVADPARVTINVHVPFEGDIPGTDLSIPFDQIAQRAAELPAERSTPLAVYCRTGPMSTTAATTLADLGYADVVELQGGMRAWQQSGRPLSGV